MKYFVPAVLLLLLSCQKDKNLLGFKSTSLAESGDAKYDSLRAKADEKPVVKYVDDEIFVTLFAEMKSCNDYNGIVSIKNDSIILGYKSLTDEACTSTSIDKLSYIIDNPAKKKYKVIFK